MIHELTLSSVTLKITKFNPPAKLINSKELSCAIGMAYKQLGLELPIVPIGEDIEKFRDESLVIIDKSIVNENLLQVVKQYVMKSESFDEDCKITMELGYEAGLK